MRVFNFVITRAKNVLPNERLAAARKLVLQKCDFLIDIGASNGDWMEKVKTGRGGYKGKALCIEPIKSSYIKLESRSLDNTQTLNCAVGNIDGNITINRASNNALSSSILEFTNHHINGAPSIKFINTEKCKILKLSTILKSNIYKKIYIKIDCQGYEYEILRSLTTSNFDRIHAFEIECSLVQVYKNSFMLESIINFLRGKGYKPLRIENGFGMPSFGQQLQVDILFVKTKSS